MKGDIKYNSFVMYQGEPARVIDSSGSVFCTIDQDSKHKRVDRAELTPTLRSYIAN